MTEALNDIQHYKWNDKTFYPLDMRHAYKMSIVTTGGTLNAEKIYSRSSVCVFNNCHVGKHM